MKLSPILKVIFRRFIIRSYYDKDGYPKKCPYCDSDSISSKVKDVVSGIACEEEYYCLQCKNSVAYWAYGYFQPIEDWMFTWEWYKWMRKHNETT